VVEGFVGWPRAEGCDGKQGEASVTAGSEASAIFLA
jgi:hypothetical protein